MSSQPLLLEFNLQENYANLANKTRTFFALVGHLYDTDWVVKMDDDVYLMPQRLNMAMKQWDKMEAGPLKKLGTTYIIKLLSYSWILFLTIDHSLLILNKCALQYVNHTITSSLEKEIAV